MTLNVFSAYSQTAFESSADVLLYLNTKGTFTNKQANITLTFSDMATRLSSGSASYYSPDVTLLNSYKAVVKYQSLNNPDGIVSFTVDAKSNTLTDRSDRTEYKANSIEEAKEIPAKPTKPSVQKTNAKSDANVKRDPNPRKDYVNVFYNPEYTLFDFFTDEPIFPDQKGVYQIYTATNENKVPKLLKGTAQEISQVTVYKFKNYKNCKNWCDGKKPPSQN